MTEPPERTALYRLYDTDDVLLYVGISTHPKSRFMQHAGDKNWWHHVARNTIEWLESREAALKAETEAIANELPLYNGYGCLGTGWSGKAREYDDTEDQQRVHAGLRAALERGEYPPNTPLHGSRVGGEFGASPCTSRAVLAKMVKEGRLVK